MDGKSSDWRPTPTVCRCCLAEGCYKDISTEYFWMGKREVYSEMLSQTLDVTIAYSQSGGPNSNSRLICEPCISRLRDATEFKRQVLECEKTFMQHLDPGRSTVTDNEAVTIDLEEKDVKLEQVKQEKQNSDDDFDNPEMVDDDDDDDLDDQPLTKLASKVPKKESVDFLDLLDNTKAAEKRKSTIKLKTPPVKRAKTKPVEAKPTASKTKAPEKKKKENPKETTTNAGRLNAAIILKHSTAYTFQPKRRSYGCCFCPTEFDDPAELRLHSDTQHPFVDKTTALNRMQKDSQLRIDITDLRCINCCNYFTNLEVLAKHLHSDHNVGIDVDKGLGLVPLKLEKDRFECVICSMKFSGYTQLSQHSGKHFLQHICHICGKRVETKRGIQIHVEKYHTNKNSGYLCRRCKKVFPSLESRRDHTRTNKQCYPLACNVCKERFRTLQKLDDHLIQIHGKPMYPCSECDKVFARRGQLYFHFKGAHTDDHKCQYCGMRFQTRRYLAEHISVRHTREPIYKCSVCEKSFLTISQLYKHRTVHDHTVKHICTICNRSFKSATTLKYHTRKEHPYAESQTAENFG